MNHRLIHSIIDKNLRSLKEDEISGQEIVQRLGFEESYLQSLMDEGNLVGTDRFCKSMPGFISGLTSEDEKLAQKHGFNRYAFKVKDVERCQSIAKLESKNTMKKTLLLKEIREHKLKIDELQKQVEELKNSNKTENWKIAVAELTKEAFAIFESDQLVKKTGPNGLEDRLVKKNSRIPLEAIKIFHKHLPASKKRGPGRSKKTVS